MDRIYRVKQQGGGRYAVERDGKFYWMRGDVFGEYDIAEEVPESGALKFLAPVTPSGRVRPGRMPAMRVARTIYSGGYDGLGAAWGAFTRWIDEQGYRAADDFWEVYRVGPESSLDSANWRTELNRPLVG